MCADFQYYLNRTGPRGPQGYKGDKGDDGKTPVPRTGTNTPIETTVIFDTGDGNPYETPNLKYPIEDRGGNMVMLDRTNETQYYGTPDQAADNSYGVVKLATPESVLDDPLDTDVVTYELFDNTVNNLNNILTNKANVEDIPTVGNGTITIKQGNSIKGTFTTNQSNNGIIELDASGGGGGSVVYTAGNGINISDNSISAKVDGITIDFDTDGNLIAIGGGGSVDAYTKAETDALLANKITTTAPTSPLEWLPDTSQSINMYGFPTGQTIIESRAGYIYSRSYQYVLGLWNSQNSQFRYIFSNPNIVNTSAAPYIETEIRNINIGGTLYYSYSEAYAYVLGFYNAGSFVPVITIQPATANQGGAITYITDSGSSDPVYSHKLADVNSGTITDSFFGLNLDNTLSTLTFSCNKNSSGTLIGSEKIAIDISQISDVDAQSRIPRCNMLRVYSTSVSQSNFSTNNLSHIKLVNPAGVVITDGDGEAINISFDNSDNILDSHLEQLNLKYDSNTLGVNSNNELYGKIGDGTITLTQGTTTLGTFSVNQYGNTSINIPASGGGGGTSYAAGDGIDISANDIISAKVDGTTIGIDSSTKEIKLLSSIPTDTSDLTNGAGYITGITSGDVTTALGYTPYSSSNPNGYTSNVGTVTSVNNNNPDSDGNVTLSIPDAQIQSDWNQTDNTEVDYIKNKPTIPDTTNMVTTNTTQTISGSKTFGTETHHQGVITFDSALGTPIIRGTSGSNYRNMITRSNTYSTVTTGNTSDNLILKGALTRPKYSHDSSDGNYLALYSDIPGDMTGAGASTAGAKGLVPAPAAGDNEKFLRGDGTWQEVSGGGTVDAYTKAETDALLVQKISGSSVETPLEYTPFTTYATLANFPSSSTVVDTGNNNPTYTYGLSGYYPDLYVYSTSLLSYKTIDDADFATACNEQPYIEVELTNGINFAYKLRNYDSVAGAYEWFGVVGGKYSGTTFIPTFTIIPAGIGGSTSCIMDFVSSSQKYPVGGSWNDFQGLEDFAMSVYYDSTSEYLYSGVSNISHNTGGLKETTDLNSSLKQLLQDTTHIRVYTIILRSTTPDNYYGNGILDLSQTRFVNPDPSDTKVAYTGIDNESRYNVYTSGTNLMTASVPEQLTLNYDSSTLGVGLNGLYAKSDNTKANTDLSNLSTTGEVKVANLGMPSNSSVNVTIPTTGGTLAAPYNGYYVIKFHSVASGIFFWHIRDNISTDYVGGGVLSDLWVWHPVAKGTVTEFDYGNVVVDSAVFVKAIGEVNS